MLDLSLPAGVRGLTAVETDRLKQHYPDLPATPLQCPTCRGKTKFKWWDDPASAEREAIEYACPCPEQWRLHRFLLNSGVGLAYQRLGWADVSAEEGAISKANQYMANIDTYIANGLGLVLHGAIGTGKTLIGVLILKGVLGDGYDGYFTTFADMVTLLMSTWDDPEDKRWFVQRVKNAGVLLIDDLGREHQQRRNTKDGMVEQVTATAMSTFESVVRHRVASARPTIITTNLDIEGVGTRYGTNVLSLLSERATTYKFTGADFRPSSRMRFADECQADLTRPVVIG